jgi:putative endonuclease
MGEHQSGALGGYTSSRLPVELVYAEQFQFITDAIAAERRIKGWSRAKKQALIDSDWDRLKLLAKRPGARTTNRTEPPHPEVLGGAEPRRTHNPGACFEGGLRPPPQHEDLGG